MGHKIFKSLIVLVAVMFVTSGYAMAADTIKEALEKGKLSGEVGSYLEMTDAEAIDSNFGWGTAYVTLKYETAAWKNVKLGARGFVHQNIYREHDDGVTDPFNVDIEKKTFIPELYLTYALGDMGSAFTVGRFAHCDISHIDDEQSEGAYLSFKEWEDVDLIFGYMRKFAEIDYDDGEDFGRENDSQNLDSNATYGSESSGYLMFAEAKFSPTENLSFNPYIMSQPEYATVYGLDGVLKLTYEDWDMDYGTEVNVYHVDADLPGWSNATAWSITPFIKQGPIAINVGYASFDDGTKALNKPEWLKDYLFTELDQTCAYGEAGSNVIFGKVKLTLGDFWTHFAYANYDDYALGSKGTGADELELQFGYQLTNNMDINLRLFDVAYDDIDDKDYKKMETRIRYRF